MLEEPQREPESRLFRCGIIERKTLRSI